MSNQRPFIIIFTDPSGGAVYQTETEYTQDYAFETMSAALEHVTELLETGDIQLGSNSVVFVLDTRCGETFRYKFEEQPRKFLWRAA